MRAAILARVSTAEQAEADRHSLPVQRQMLADYAAREGMELVGAYEIPGESAFTDDLARRPQFGAAISAAERGEFEALLVYDLSRFARDQFLLHDSLRRLRRAGVRLIGVAMGVDYTENPMLAGMEGVFAEASSREHSRRVRHAYARRHELGLPTGDIPFGYRGGRRADGAACCRAR